MLWKEKYFEKFDVFIQQMLSWDPDYIVPVARKACKLLKVIGGDVKVPFEKVFFKKYFEFCTPDITGKKIAVLDDSADYGGTLFEHREFFAKLNSSASVQCFAFAVKRSNIEQLNGGYFYDPDPKIGMCLSDQAYLEYVLSQRNLLDSIGEHLDIDHLLLQLQFPSLKKLEEIISLIQSMGSVYFVESNTKNIRKFSLDFPSFLKASELKKLNRFLRFDGIFKIRFYADTVNSILSICPMVFPSFISSRVKDYKKLDFLPNLKMINNLIVKKKNNELRYMCLSLELGALISARLLSFFKTHNLLADGIEKIRVNNDDFRRFFGNDCGEKIAKQVKEFLFTSIKDRFTLDDDYIRVPRVEHGLFKHEEKDYSDYLRSGYLRAIKDAGKTIGIHYSRTFRELCEGSSETCESLSELLDYDCDNGIVVPCIESRNNGELLVRSYRTGEAKEDIAWERTKHFIPLVIDIVSKELDTPTNGAPPQFVTKMLANFATDYPKETCESLHLLEREPYLYGTEVSVRNKRYTKNNVVYLNQSQLLGNKYKVLKDGGKVKGFLAFQDWDNEWEKCFSNESDIEVPESEIHLYFEFLLEIYRTFGKKSKILTWLSIGRNFEWFYYHVYSNLEIWISNIDQFLDRFNDLHYDDSLEGKHISQSANTCVQAKLKVEDYDNINQFILQVIEKYRDVKYRKFVERLRKQHELYPTDANRLRQLKNAGDLQHAFSVLIQSTLSIIKSHKAILPDNEGFKKYFDRFATVYSRAFPSQAISFQLYTESTKNILEFKNFLKEMYAKIRDNLSFLSRPLGHMSIKYKIFPKPSVNKLAEICKVHNLLRPTIVFGDYTGYLKTLSILERNDQNKKIKDEYFEAFIEIFVSAFKLQDGIECYRGPSGDDLSYIFGNRDAAFRAVAMGYEKLKEKSCKLTKDIPIYAVRFGIAEAEMKSTESKTELMNAFKSAFICSQHKPEELLKYSNCCIVTDIFYDKCDEGQREFFRRFENELIKSGESSGKQHNAYLFDWNRYLSQEAR